MMLFDKWYEVSTLTTTDLEDEKIVEVMAGDKKLCLVKKGEKVFGFASNCPHAGVSFCEGWIDATGRVVCPQHHFKFDPANGRNTSGEGYKLKTFPVKIRDARIFVQY